MPNEQKPIILNQSTSLDLRELRIKNNSTTALWTLSGALLAACGGGGGGIPGGSKLLEIITNPVEQFPKTIFDQSGGGGGTSVAPAGTPTSSWQAVSGIEQSASSPNNDAHVVYDFGYRVHLGDHNGNTDSEKATELFGFADPEGNTAQALPSGFYGIFINPTPSLTTKAIHDVRILYNGAALAADQQAASDMSDITAVAAALATEAAELGVAYYYVSLENLANLVVASGSNAAGRWGFDYRVWDGERVSQAGSQVIIDIESVNDVGVFYFPISDGSMVETDHDGSPDELDTGITFDFVDDDDVDLDRFSVSDPRFAVRLNQTEPINQGGRNSYKVVLLRDQELDFERTPTLTLTFEYTDSFGEVATMTDTNVVAGAMLTVRNLAEAPVEVRNVGATMLIVGGTRALTAQHLLYEDDEQAATAITYTLTDISQLAAQGLEIRKSGTAMAVGGTFTQADLDAGNVISIVQNDTTHPTPTDNDKTLEFRFRVNDGDPASPAGEERSFGIQFPRSATETEPGLFAGSTQVPVPVSEGELTAEIRVSENARGPASSSFDFGDGTDLKSDLILTLDVGGTPTTIYQGTTTFTTEFMYGMLEVTRPDSGSSQLRYTVDRDLAAVNGLTDDPSSFLEETFDLTVSDPDDSALAYRIAYTFRITGFNDSVWFDVTSGIHSNTGTVTEDGTTRMLVNQPIGIVDPDTPIADVAIGAAYRNEQGGEITRMMTAGVAGTIADIETPYGTFSFVRTNPSPNNGIITWSYTLKNDEDSVQDLIAGREVREVVELRGGTTQTSIVVTVKGTSEPPDFADAADVTPLTMTENEETRMGEFTFRDSDDSLGSLIIIESRGDTAEKNDSRPIPAGTTIMKLDHGTFTFTRDDTAGTISWIYRLDTESDEVDDLLDNQMRDETFTLAIRDRHDDEVDDTVRVNITITGINDPLEFRSPPTEQNPFGTIVIEDGGTVVEDDLTRNSVEGAFTIIDTDTALSSIALVASGTRGNSPSTQPNIQGGETIETTYGTFTLSLRNNGDDTSGELRWRYVLDNGKSAVQNLTEEIGAQDIITLTGVGTTMTITIDIEGATDVGGAPLIESRSTLTATRSEGDERGVPYTIYFGDQNTAAALLDLEVGIDANADGMFEDSEFSDISLNTELATSHAFARILFANRNPSLATDTSPSGSIQWSYLLKPTAQNPIPDQGGEEEIRIRITNEAGEVTEGSLNVTIRADLTDNTIPMQEANTGIEIEVGQTYLLINTDTIKRLSYTDTDNTADELVYRLGSFPGNGVSLHRVLDPNTMAIGPRIQGGTFTQAELDAGMILQHDGILRGGTSTQFKFAVLDGVNTITTPPSGMGELAFSIRIVPSTDNTPPIQRWNLDNVDVPQGEVVAITQSSLNFVDNEQGAGELTYTITPLHGSITHVSDEGVQTPNTTTFTQEDINMRRIFFVHAHNDILAATTTEIGFNFNITDGTNIIRNLGYRLMLGDNRFPIFRPQTIDDKVVVTIIPDAARATEHELTLTVMESNDPNAMTQTRDQDGIFTFRDGETTNNAAFYVNASDYNNANNIPHNAEDNGVLIAREYGDFRVFRNDTNGTITVRYTLNNDHIRLDGHNTGDEPLEDFIEVRITDTGNPPGTDNAKFARVKVTVQIEGLTEASAPPREVANTGITLNDAIRNSQLEYLSNAILEYVDAHQGPEQITYTLGDLTELEQNGIQIALGDVNFLTGATFTQAQINNVVGGVPQPIIFFRQIKGVEPTAQNVVLNFTVSDGDSNTADVDGTFNITINHRADPPDLSLEEFVNVTRVAEGPAAVPDDPKGFNIFAERGIYFFDDDTPRANLFLTVQVGTLDNLSNARNLTTANTDANRIFNSAYGTFRLDREDTTAPHPTTGRERGIVRFRYEVDTQNAEVNALLTGETRVDNIRVHVRDAETEAPDKTETMNIQIRGMSEATLPEQTNSTGSPMDTGLTFIATSFPNMRTVFALHDDRFVVAQGVDSTTYKLQLKDGATLNFEDPANPDRVVLIGIDYPTQEHRYYAALTLTDVNDAPEITTGLMKPTLTETDAHPTITPDNHSELFITNAHLEFTDEDEGDGPNMITYTLTDISDFAARGIQILKGTTILGTGATDEKTFTQDDINNSRIKLRQLTNVEPTAASGDATFMYTVADDEGLSPASGEQTFTFGFTVVDDDADFTAQNGFTISHAVTEGTTLSPDGGGGFVTVVNTARITQRVRDSDDNVANLSVVWTRDEHHPIDLNNGNDPSDDITLNATQQTIHLTYGSIVVTYSGGEVFAIYTPGRSLAGSVTMNEIMTFAIRDKGAMSRGLQDYVTVTVAVTGIEDPIAFNVIGDHGNSGTVKEDGTTAEQAIGDTTIGISDPDTALADTTITVTEVANTGNTISLANTGGTRTITTTYGVFTFEDFELIDSNPNNGTLTWSYQLTNNADAVQNIAGGTTQPDAITLTVGSVETTITANIEGATEITYETSGAHSATGGVTEDGTAMQTQTLAQTINIIDTSVDVATLTITAIDGADENNTGEITTVDGGSLTTAYGVFTFMRARTDADNALITWSYQLTTSADVVQELTPNRGFTDTVELMVGDASTTISVDITGALEENEAYFETYTSPRTITENEESITGMFTFQDADTVQEMLIIAENGAPTPIPETEADMPISIGLTYGTLKLERDDRDGMMSGEISWTYELNNLHPTVQLLDPDSDPLTDTFALEIRDTANEDPSDDTLTVVIEIEGASGVLTNVDGHSPSFDGRFGVLGDRTEHSTGSGGNRMRFFDEATAASDITFYALPLDPADENAFTEVEVELIEANLHSDLVAPGNGAQRITTKFGVIWFEQEEDTHEGDGTTFLMKYRFSNPAENMIDAVTVPDTIRLRLVDGDGNIRTQNFTMIITGENDAIALTLPASDPSKDLTVSGNTFTVAMTESDHPDTGTEATDSFSFTFTDEETALGDIVIAHGTEVADRILAEHNSGNPKTAMGDLMHGTFSIYRADDTGTLTWSYTLDNSTLDNHNQGVINDTLTLTLTDTGLSDNFGGRTPGASQEVTLTIAITGTSEDGGAVSAVQGSIAESNLGYATNTDTGIIFDYTHADGVDVSQFTITAEDEAYSGHFRVVANPSGGADSYKVQLRAEHAFNREDMIVAPATTDGVLDLEIGYAEVAGIVMAELTITDADDGTNQSPFVSTAGLGSTSQLDATRREDASSSTTSARTIYFNDPDSTDATDDRFTFHLGIYNPNTDEYDFTEAALGGIPQSTPTGFPTTVTLTNHVVADQTNTFSRVGWQYVLDNTDDDGIPRGYPHPTTPLLHPDRPAGQPDGGYADTSIKIKIIDNHDTNPAAVMVDVIGYLIGFEDYATLSSATSSDTFMFGTDTTAEGSITITDVDTTPSAMVINQAGQTANIVTDSAIMTADGTFTFTRTDDDDTVTTLEWEYTTNTDSTRTDTITLQVPGRFNRPQDITISVDVTGTGNLGYSEAGYSEAFGGEAFDESLDFGYTDTSSEII